MPPNSPKGRGINHIHITSRSEEHMRRIAFYLTTAMLLAYTGSQAGAQVHPPNVDANAQNQTNANAQPTLPAPASATAQQNTQVQDQTAPQANTPRPPQGTPPNTSVQ